MAYKVFQNGFPLLASELNNYLMNQAVISFATATDRDNVLTSPIEGQLVWLADLNKYTYYTGAAWADLIAPPGQVFTEQTTNYTIVAGDAQSTIAVNNASGVTVTIADVLSPGERVDFIQKGAGQITFDAAVGLTLNSKDSLYLSAGQYAGVTVICEDTNLYYLIGNLA